MRTLWWTAERLVGAVLPPGERGRDCATLLDAQPVGGAAEASGAAQRQLAEAEAKVRRYQEAIAAGMDPAALVEVLNQAQAERAAAWAEVERAPTGGEVSWAEVYAMIDSLGDIGVGLKEGKPAGLARLY